ncbi:MAG: phenylalanine--tRNA ligase subunit beta [Bacilli bacterium]
MLFSYKLLSTLVDLSKTDPKTLRSRLTFAGFEVEGMEPLASGDKLIIGQILTCVKHPDSDHLHCLTVDLGPKEGIRNIVCGAPNARVGLKVIVALPGCHLPAINETIEKGVIRGQESDGMCCSLVELGVNKDTLAEKQIKGIEELPLDAKVGDTKVLEYLSLDDTILDVNVLPNRPDCLSYLGLAREISSLTGFKLNPVPSFKEKELKKTLSPISDTKFCPRIDILSLRNLQPVKETPKKYVQALLANGIRSISPIVDLGNYVMLLTGQPLNMYDADKNPTGKYVVRDDFEGKGETFDGKKLDLQKGDIVITDGTKPLCLGGIMTFKDSLIEASTKNVDVEFAIFYHANIRHTSARLGLSSASAQLFAKERNPRMINEAIAVTLSLLKDFFVSFEIKGYGSFDQSEKEVKPFAYSLEATNHRLGSDYTESEAQQVLKAFRITKKGNLLLPPVDRVDLLEQCDIDEEIFRYYGSERIKPNLDHFPLTLGKLSPEQKGLRDIRELLVSRGLLECLTYTLVDEKNDPFIRVFDQGPSYKILNPMTKDHEFVRQDLLPSLLLVMDYNLKHSHPDMALFEASPVDTPKGNHEYLSLLLKGNVSLTENFKTRPYDFFDIKGLVESIFLKLGIPSTRYRLVYSKNPAFHPSCSADIFMGKDLVGTFGQLHPLTSSEKVFVAEIDLGYLLSLKGRQTHYVINPSLASVRRDLSFKVSDEVSFAQLKKTILQTKDSFVRSVSLFDDFFDKATDQHYLGVSVYLGKDEATLKDSEINDAMENIVKNVKTVLGLELRGENHG